MKFTIREASLSDRDFIVNFQVAMALETESLLLEKTTVTRGVEAVLVDSSKGKYIVAEINGRVVGSLMMTYEWSDWRNGKVYWIQSVYVEEEYRKKGIFRALYTRVKDIVLASKDIMGIRLYVDRTNDRAQNVYRNLGMDGDHYKVFEWMGD
ncbi:MAG: GNAT family N-acetyltransferase [Cyclobacteriaceae bacterium]|nr:GNAT family N-acetyltransferase [Cyclobacteriaceae bacterium]